MVKFFIVCTLSLCSLNFFGQQCDSSLITVRKIRASDTDSRISWELATHYTFFNENCAPQNTLLIYLVGSYDNPLNSLKFPSLAANHGYHVVSLKYPNSVAAKTACAASTDPNCYLNFRKEIIEGVDYSNKVTVNDTDCIQNRLLKLIQHLSAFFPAENWDQYIIGNKMNWEKVMTAGHSQGGGHAAVLGINNALKRVLMFASPNDYSNHFNAPSVWCSGTFSTPASAFYGFNNLQDDVVSFDEQKQIWAAMPFSTNDDTTSVDSFTSPFGNSHMLYTNYHGGTETSQNHNAVVRDSHTPLTNLGRPAYEEVWKYMLENDLKTSVFAKKRLKKYRLSPNPVEKSFFITKNDKFLTFSKIEIYNIQGEKIKSISQHLSDKIVVRGLSSGIYFAVISTEDAQNVKIKFIKL